MRTLHFGFGSTKVHTLATPLSILKKAAAVICPTLLCMLVTASAILQPYSAASHPAYPGDDPHVESASISSDVCAFADLSCIQRQSELQVAQTQFLTRQYPLILKTAQDLGSKRVSSRMRAAQDTNDRLAELSQRIRVMSLLYNADAAHTDPALLSEHHLPAQLTF